MTLEFMCFTCKKKLRKPKEFGKLPEKCPKCGGNIVQEMCCNTCKFARIPEGYPERLDGWIECGLDGHAVEIGDRCKKFEPMKVS